MTTLITGGNGKTGLNLAQLHHAASKPFLITSRSGSSPNPAFASNAVKFDWFDPSTFGNPFKAAQDIDKMYLIAPPSLGALGVAKPFIDLAVQKGVKRIVFLSASDVHIGEEYPGLGKIHEYLDGIEAIWYAALRPTWFTENLSQTYASTILSDDKIYTACGDGLIPFVSAEDIAQAAYDGLFAHETGDKAWTRGRAPRILGPESITYDDVASIMSDVLGRKITHIHLSEGDAHPAWDAANIPKQYQKLLEVIELRGAKGQEDEYLTGKGPEGVVDKVVGPRTVRAYVEREKKVWAKE